MKVETDIRSFQHKPKRWFVSFRNSVRESLLSGWSLIRQTAHCYRGCCEEGKEGPRESQPIAFPRLTYLMVTAQVQVER